MKLKSFLAVTVLVVAAGCGDNQYADTDAGGEPDLDGDGYSEAAGDCDDNNRNIYPGAPDPCDGIDQNCDLVADEAFDLDGDHWSSCAGDCRDNDATSYPGATEVVDGADNDCDGIPDNHTTQYDDDGDGYSEDQGDCNDDPATGGALISPGAVEVQLNSDGEPEGIDNDCDGEIDEELAPCPEGLPGSDPNAYASAFDACLFVTRADWNTTLGIDDRSRGLFSDYGDTYVPRAGSDFFVLSSGIVGDAADPGFDNLSTDMSVTAPHPDPQGAMGCSEADASTINDYTEVSFQLQVPANANAFSFDFNFMSIEFPEYVCTSYDDTFLAMLESQAFTGNVSFDSVGNRVSINVGFFDVCATTLDPACTGDADIIGTGYEGSEGGGTGWLTTTAPVVPNEKISLTFSIFDEGDHILDSAVILDNFRWEIEPVEGPITVPFTDAPLSRFRVSGSQPVAAQ